MSILWGARFFSYLSESLTESLIAILVWKYTDSPVLAALVIASGRLALWLFGFHAGKTAARPDKDNIAKVTSLFCMIVFFVYAIIANLWSISVWLLFSTNFLCMAAKTYEHAAINALVTNIKRSDSFYSTKISIDSTKRWARFSSPILFMILLSYEVDASVLAYLAILYFISFALYCLCTFPNLAEDNLNTKAVSFRSIYRTAQSKPLLFLFSAFMLYNFSYFSIHGIFLPKLFESSGKSVEYGFALLAGSIGGVVGNRIYKNFIVPSIFNKLLLAFFLVALSSFMFSLSFGNAIILLGCFIGGLALPVMDMAILEAIRTYLPANSHGMGFSLFRFMADTGLVVGGYLGGLALSNMNLENAFLAAAVWIGLVGALALSLRIKYLYTQN